ncbi:GTPase-activating protein [Coemansia sp. RSA 988]|nr:GTPase-activating protein [Coemansia sp. RSA 988]
MKPIASGFWRRTPAYTPSEVSVHFSGSVSASLPKAENQITATAKQPQAENTSPDRGASNPPKKDETEKSTDSSTRSSDSSNHNNNSIGDAAQERFHAVVTESNVDLVQLQRLSWKGIPGQYRSTAWQLLLGYLPLNKRRREPTLQRKRKEYDDMVRQTFGRGEGSLDRALWHQIRIDVPRTTSGSAIFRSERVQRSLERILYCWAARHPASGYVQGINDLLTPFVSVFLEPHLEEHTESAAEALNDDVAAAAEADSFWCLTRLLDGIQDNYTHAQPGVLRQIVKMKELVARIDAPLAQHLEAEGVEFMQFAFRWINCLLLREVSLSNTVRMWDTCLAEPDGFSSFHTYLCAAFLLRWSRSLLTMDFQQIIVFLQRPPTDAWRAEDVELLLSEAYMYKCLYHGSPSHYATTTARP